MCAARQLCWKASPTCCVNENLRRRSSCNCGAPGWSSAGVTSSYSAADCTKTISANSSTRNMSNSPRIYTNGGPVQVGGGLYIERQADRELLSQCREGNYCFVLSSRQV